MLNVRPMQAQDVAEIHAIEIQTYKTPWSFEIIRDCVRVGYDCRILEYMSEHKTVKVGYVISRIHEKTCHILNLCIATPFQNQGMGKFLLQEVIQSAANRGLTLIILEVRPSNFAGLALYKAFGFECFNVKKRYYRDADGEEDALALRKLLNKEG